ncbi:MAG TPA: DUF1440 domain-containing protein [Acetobacteraceae bacterium]|jgi:hypothetical protein
MFWQQERHSTVKGLAAGAIGGMVASFVMNQFQAGMSKLFEEPQAPHRREQARQAQGWKEHRGGQQQQQDGGEENATVKAAVAISENVFDHQLAPQEKPSAGNAVHYATGILTGAVYGAAAENLDVVRAGEGTAFGAMVWAIADEVTVPGLRLSRPPREYPLRTHVMALSAHLVYGVTTEMVRRALRAGALSR